jgi:hypothetical protein
LLQKAFKKFLVVHDNNTLILNGNEIEAVKPPRNFEPLGELTDLVFSYDLKILETPLYIKKNKTTTTAVVTAENYPPSQQNQPVKVKDIKCCLCNHFSSDTISCSEMHITCQKCFRKQCQNIIRYDLFVFLKYIF